MGYPLDNLAQLGEWLIRKHHLKPRACFITWKLDISKAYRLCPMHKLWQIKQVMRVKGKLAVMRINVFGGSASSAIFISLNLLLAWAAEKKWFIESLVYINDSFRVDEEGDVDKYKPYCVVYPAQQARLL